MANIHSSDYPVPQGGGLNPLNWIPPTRDIGLMANLMAGKPYSYLPLMDKIERARFDRYYAALQGAGKKAPGEKLVTASVKDFIEKRAALQKTAISPVAAGEAARGFLPALKKWALPASLFGGAIFGLEHLSRPLVERLGYKGREKAYPGITGLPERVRMSELAAEEAAKGFGNQLGKSTVGLLGDLLSKATDAPSAMMASNNRESIFDALQKEDDVIARADPDELAEAYHTMVRFAPTLSTDKNAVKTFLRESVLYGTGPNPMAIKQLAEAEEAVKEIQSPNIFENFGPK